MEIKQLIVEDRQIPLMKKILFINSLYFPNIIGGVEIIMQEQAEHFSKMGYPVAVLTTGEKGNGLNTDMVNGIKVYRAGIKNIYWFSTPNKPNKYVRMLWHLKDIYNKGMRTYVKEVIDIEKPDIVFCHNLCGFSISAWDEIKAVGLPIIQVLHDLYLMCPRSTMFKKGHACEKQCGVCHWMCRNHRKKSQVVDAVVGVSAYVLNKLKQAGYFENVPSYVIHNAKNISEPSKRLVWSEQEPLRIGYIGILTKAKGVEWLITQFMYLDNINATLTIAGRGESIEYEKYLKELASKDKRIIFSGYVKPVEHYTGIYLSVVPSICPDTFPSVAFESCAYHVPVIATKMGGLPEIIKDGVNGWLCDVDNSDSLGKTILHIYNSSELLHSVSNRARESVSEMLDMERMMIKYEELARI
ncbi:N-acetyl-alpha-D-glucosaminyl L-malate synthase [termite gut metagenome]|uniref:N-acetyl-alpha-D-glucosaminyl L-malate synthase n=1 Tax=termite gut metagenome TaxID=433724 RepID=A0A5J4SFU0_9ZZZZ